MLMSKPTPYLEVLDETMAAVLREKTEAQRLAIANNLWVYAHDLLRWVQAGNHGGDRFAEAGVPPVDHDVRAEGEIVAEVFAREGRRASEAQHAGFPLGPVLVLNGAGGGVACAAVLTLADTPDIVGDQTLYWTLVASLDEAWYRVGLINTDALTQAIREFNPEGELGPRHLDTLPNRVIPPFDPSNLDHVEVRSLAEQLAVLARPLITADRSIANSNQPVAARRRRLRNSLKEGAEFVALEDVTSGVLRSPRE